MTRNLAQKEYMSSGRNIKFLGLAANTVDSNQPLALSLARSSASSAVPPLAEPLLPFSITVAFTSDDPLRFSTVTVFSSFVTLMSRFLSGLQQTQHRNE